jgi:hypothetical protein
MRQGTTPLAVLLSLALAGVGLAAPAEDDAWALPDGLQGVRVAPIFLLSRTDVQADLGMTDEQVLSARRTIADLYARAASLRGKPDLEAIAERRVIDEAQRRWLENQLSDAQQARLLQLDLQWEGPTAILSRSWVTAQLELSPAQRRSLRTSMVDHPAEALQSVLTPDQRTRWQALLGQALRFGRAH